MNEVNIVPKIHTFEKLFKNKFVEVMLSTNKSNLIQPKRKVNQHKNKIFLIYEIMIANLSTYSVMMTALKKSTMRKNKTNVEEKEICRSINRLDSKYLATPKKEVESKENLFLE